MPITSATPRTRHAYDHRLREHVLRSDYKSLARYVAIPLSTVASWQRRGLRPVLTIEALEQDRLRLLDSIAKLDCRVWILGA
jgi:hypothetical protein